MTRIEGKNCCNLIVITSDVPFCMWNVIEQFMNR